MKSNSKGLMWVAIPTIVLMAMGLVFCWVVPTNAQLYGAGSHFFFARMTCWTGIGLSLGTCACLLGWRWWLTAAPYIAAVWGGLMVYSMVSPLTEGHWGWIGVGVFKIDVLAFVPVVGALMVASVVRFLRCRAIWIVGAVVLVLGGLTVRKIARDTYRDERFHLLPSHQKMAEEARQTPYEFVRARYGEAIGESRWFGPSAVDAKELPYTVTTGMPVAATTLFGRWWLVLLSAALVVLGAAFGLIGWQSDDESLRAYAYMLGLGIVVPSLLNVAGCVGWIPILSLGIPFVAYGGSLVVATLVGMGILCSALTERGLCNEIR